METDWMLDEIATGLQKLYLLSLDRTPAAELLTGTAKAWLEALSYDRSWERIRDAPRMRAAFVILARTREQWPAPRHFIDALPHVSLPLMLDKEFRPANPETVAKAKAEVEAYLNKDEPELDRKTMAAGGD